MTRNRFWDADAIQQGACNPSGIARSLVKAIDEARADPGIMVIGTDGVRADPAVRLIVHQLAFLMNTIEYDTDPDSYARDLRMCE